MNTNTQNEYEVKITETLERVVKTKAESAKEAQQDVTRGYRQAEYVLGADDFSHVSIDVKPVNSATVVCPKCGRTISAYTAVELDQDTLVCYTCAHKQFDGEDYRAARYMHRTQDVVQVAMTPEMIEYVKSKIAGDIDEYDYDETNPMAEVLYDNLEKAASNSGESNGILNCPVLYVSCYESTQMYGGPEEGGWYYWHNQLVGSTPCNTFEQVRECMREDIIGLRCCFDAQDQKLCDGIRVDEVIPTAAELDKAFYKPYNLDWPAPGESARKYIARSFKVERGFYYKFVVETQQGGLSTVHTPIYE